MGAATTFRLTPDSEGGDSFIVIILCITAMVFNFSMASWAVEVGEIAQKCETMVFYFQDIMNYYLMVF
jgi:hypothetical protein